MKNMGIIGGWTAKQRNHLRRAIKAGATIAYWNSDAHGRPANHGMSATDAAQWTARPGLVQKVEGPLDACSSHALHATFAPHRWSGCRVWVVAMYGDIARESDKIASLHREIIGEILPEYAFSASVGVRVGRKDLSSADLSGANLTRADLSGADLSGANLTRADLSGANLTRANLSSSDLYGANLTRVNLSSADLYGANLSSADLSGANLTRANLTRANLTRANLTRADLYGANLTGANLTGADLSGADLSGADLYGANLRYANLTRANLTRVNLSSADLSSADLYGAKIAPGATPPDGWKSDAYGYLTRI